MVWTLYLDESGTFGTDPNAVSGGVLFRGPVGEREEERLRDGFAAVYPDGLWPPHRAARDHPSAMVAMAMWAPDALGLWNGQRLAELGHRHPVLRQAFDERRFPTRDELEQTEPGRLQPWAQREIRAAQKEVRRRRRALLAALPCAAPYQWVAAAAACEAEAPGLLDAHVAAVRRALLFAWEQGLDTLRVVVEHHTLLPTAAELTRAWSGAAERILPDVNVQVEIAEKGAGTPAGLVVADHVCVCLRAGPCESLADIARRTSMSAGRPAAGRAFDETELPSILRAGAWHTAVCRAADGMDDSPDEVGWAWEGEQAERWIEWLLEAP